jgi:ParB/RepB/Spo0J family partition protein
MPAKPTQRSPFRAYVTKTLPGEELANARLLPRDLIDPNPWQPRQHADPERLAELRADIEARGILQPLVVRPHGEDRYQVVAGERRYQAAGLAGLTHLPCVIRDVDDAEAQAMALVENLQREDLDIEDEANFLATLHDSGMSLREIGAAIHKSYQYVNRRIKLAADPEALRAYRAGQLNLNQLIADRSDLPEAVPMDELADAARSVAGEAVTPGNSPDGVRTGAGVEEVRFLRHTSPVRRFEKFQEQVVRRIQPEALPTEQRENLRPRIRSLITYLEELDSRLGEADADMTP